MHHGRTFLKVWWIIPFLLFLNVSSVISKGVHIEHRDGGNDSMPNGQGDTTKKIAGEGVGDPIPNAEGAPAVNIDNESSTAPSTQSSSQYASSITTEGGGYTDGHQGNGPPPDFRQREQLQNIAEAMMPNDTSCKKEKCPNDGVFWIWRKAKCSPQVCDTRTDWLTVNLTVVLLLICIATSIAACCYFCCCHEENFKK